MVYHAWPILSFNTIIAPRFLASGEAATVTADSRLAGPSAEMAVEGLMAPTTTTGAPQLTVMSIAKAVSSCQDKIHQHIYRQRDTDGSPGYRYHE